jgi:endonuclease/exonuclease/phosphatase (EEP) superfamily protein YafD
MRVVPAWFCSPVKAITHNDATRIDFLWQRGVTVIEGGVIRGLMLSDHDPLWAVVEVE